MRQYCKHFYLFFLGRRIIIKWGYLINYEYGVYDITKADGSIWGLNEFLEFSVQSFNVDHSNLDRLLSYAQELSQEEEFDDDFTILEIVFE